MATLERTYIIPLRKQINKSPSYKRAKKAVNTVKEFLVKHMKSEDVKIGQKINRLLWERGIKNPPSKIKVSVTKDDAGVVKAELFGHTYVEKKREVKVEKSKLEQLKEKLAGEKSKAAVSHVPTEEKKTHIPTDRTKDLKNAAEKERKVATGTTQAQHKDKQ